MPVGGLSPCPHFSEATNGLKMDLSDHFWTGHSDMKDLLEMVSGVCLARTQGWDPRIFLMLCLEVG